MAAFNPYRASLALNAVLAVGLLAALISQSASSSNVLASTVASRGASTACRAEVRTSSRVNGMPRSSRMPPMGRRGMIAAITGGIYGSIQTQQRSKAGLFGPSDR